MRVEGAGASRGWGNGYEVLEEERRSIYMIVG